MVAHLQNVTAASVTWYKELIKATDDGANITSKHSDDFVELAATVAYVTRLVMREFDAVQTVTPPGTNPLIALNLLRTIGESSLVAFSPPPRDVSLMISAADLEHLITSPTVAVWVRKLGV